MNGRKTGPSAFITLREVLSSGEFGPTGVALTRHRLSSKTALWQSSCYLLRLRRRKSDICQDRMISNGTDISTRNYPEIQDAPIGQKREKLRNSDCCRSTWLYAITARQLAGSLAHLSIMGKVWSASSPTAFPKTVAGVRSCQSV